jgi:hypothetical protein
MINFNLEMMPKQVRMPDIHSVQNGQHLFFIGGFSQVFSQSCLLVKANGLLLA